MQGLLTRLLIINVTVLIIITLLTKSSFGGLEVWLRQPYD